MNPEISVILPVFNASRYLDESIKSILGQSFRDFELIAIDDGSSDHSYDILRKYSSLDNRIRFFRKDHLGLSRVLNEAIEVSRGKYIARMDADDISHPKRLEAQLNFLKSQKVDLCGASVSCFGNARSTWRYPLTHEGCEARLLFGVCFAHPVVMGRAEVFRRLGYSEDFLFAQDYDLWQRAFEFGYQFANMQDALLKYRVHRQQISSIKKIAQSKLASRIRERHFRFVYPYLYSPDVAESINKLFDGEGASLDVALEFFIGAIDGKSEEGRKEIVNGFFSLLSRNAEHNPQVVNVWRRFSFAVKDISLFDIHKGEAVLRIIRALKIQRGGKFDRMLKKIGLR